MPKTSKNRNLVNLMRLSGAAIRKLRTVLGFAAIVLRDKILDETLNKHAERGETDGDAQAAGALSAAREIAVRLGAAYRDAYLAGYSIQNWYQACGLDPNGELHDGLFDDDIKTSRYPDQEDVRALLGAAQKIRSIASKPNKK